MREQFGIWLITKKRSFLDPAISREDCHGFDAQTRLQRAAGVRYQGRSYPKVPDAKVGFGSFVARNKHRSIARLFKGHYGKGPVARGAFSLREGHLATLARATGYALISTRRLRPVSIPGAVFVGYMRIPAGKG